MKMEVVSLFGTKIKHIWDRRASLSGRLLAIYHSRSLR